MICILSTRGAFTRLRSAPFTETTIEGVHSVVYRPGIEPVPLTGADETDGSLGTFERGLPRISGYLFSYDGSVAETLLALEDDIDLIIRYRANGQKRRRTLTDILFVGDATVTVPGLNTGIPELIGVPFRVQIPQEDGLADHVLDVEES